MSVFDHTKRKRFEGSHLIGILLIAAGSIIGVLSIFIDFNAPYNNMLPLIICLLVIGLILIFTFSGLEIDFTRNVLREYFSFCGIKLGKWTPVPPIRKIKLKSSSQKIVNVKNGISPTMSGTVREYRIVLYANQATPFLSFSYSKKEESLRNAELFSINFNTAVEIEA